MSNLTKERIGELQIIASVIFYAIAFVASRAAMVGGSKLGPISFAACRFLVSTVLLYLVKPLASKLFHVELESDDGPEDSSNNGSNKYFHLLLWGGLCGLANFGASTLAQIGLVTVSAGKAGFITGMYVVFIPLAEYLIPGYGIHLTYKSWVAAVLCLVGLYLMSGCAEQEVCLGGAFQSGEVLMLLSMLCWIVTIMAGDAGAKTVNVISLTYVDFLLCTLLTLVTAVWLEPADWQYPYSSIRGSWRIIATVAVAEGLASPLCGLGQMYLPPARASLLMSLEAVSCAALGYLCLGETLSLVELAGGVLMFAATLITTSLDESEGHTDSSIHNIVSRSRRGSRASAGGAPHSRRGSHSSNSEGIVLLTAADKGLAVSYQSVAINDTSSDGV